MRTVTKAEYHRELARLIAQVSESWRRCAQPRCRRARGCAPLDRETWTCVAPPLPSRNLTPEQENEEMSAFYKLVKARYEAVMARAGEAPAAPGRSRAPPRPKPRR